MRIAVLGANSFSGSAFVVKARAEGHEVLELSRSNGSHDLNSGIANIVAASQEFGAQCFVNFAALNVVADSWQHFADYYRTNVIGVARLADGLRGIEKFVQVSTPEVYGDSPDLLTPEAHYKPTTPYAISRAAADMHLAALHSSSGFPVCFTRTVNVYGPAQQPYRIIPKTVLKILRGQKLKLDGGGQSQRSFIHVRDMAAGTLAVVVAGAAGKVYHFATPLMTRIRGLVAQICTRMGVNFSDVVEDVRERSGKDRMYRLRWEGSKRDLEWEPEVALEDGLAETVAWFQEHAKDYENHSLEYEHRP